MTEWKKWKKAAMDIAKENDRLHDTGELSSDEFIFIPPAPVECEYCRWCIDYDCVAEMCYNFDRFEHR